LRTASNFSRLSKACNQRWFCASKLENQYLQLSLYSEKPKMRTMTKEVKTDSPSRQLRGRKTMFIVGVSVAVLLCVWLLFRPELLFIDKQVNESLPGTAMGKSSEPMTLASGSFHGVAHETKGMASIHQLADGKRVVRLTNFETSNGPDVHLFLIGSNDAADNAMVKEKGFVDLGSLKGNIGDQNYDVPDDVDLSKYHAVTVWCNRFGVNFGTAPLTRGAGSGSSQMANNKPVSLSAGKFHSVAHETKGNATIFRLADDQRVLRLADFETSNGPDVRVYLVAANDARDSETVKTAGFVELGKLKGNVGDQNYDIPPSVDLDKYRAVTIWCARFGVNFGTAPLQ
jgi:hypothetical protein